MLNGNVPDEEVGAGLLPVPDGEPRSAGARYEVVDAKLARSAKARAVAQKTPLDWHRREAKPGWWRHFYLRALGRPS